MLPARAALDLELTQGIDAALPITIVPFTNEEAGAPGGLTITRIIANDLQNSGQFRVKKNQQGVDDVLTGSVNLLGFGRYRINFQLNNALNKADSAIASESFTVSRLGLRALAHHISDIVYQKLTGIRGIFSTKIAYILVKRETRKRPQYLLEVSDADGFDPQTLLKSSQPIMSPAWSPDGKSIMYVSFEGHRATIYLQNLASGKRQVVTDYPGINGAPAFSPDGTMMALVLTKTGNPKIYTYNFETRNLTQLTHGYSIDTEPAWAPDGQSILFTSNRGGTPQIYHYTFSTKRVMRVTFEGNYNARASFLPNGHGMVMMHRQTGMFGIARESLETGKLQALVKTGADESPSVAPNGQMVIYATEYGGRGVLAMVSMDGRIKLRLPAREGAVREPAWSPFLN